jgi:hypothetical protein
VQPRNLLSLSEQFVRVENRDFTATLLYRLQTCTGDTKFVIDDERIYKASKVIYHPFKKYFYLMQSLQSCTVFFTLPNRKQQVAGNKIL